jgi:hypothetical protein
LYCKIRYVGKQVLSISEKSEFTFEIENTVENIRYCKTAGITDSKR